MTLVFDDGNRFIWDFINYTYREWSPSQTVPRSNTHRKCLDGKIHDRFPSLNYRYYRMDDNPVTLYCWFFSRSMTALFIQHLCIYTFPLQNARKIKVDRRNYNIYIYIFERSKIVHVYVYIGVILNGLTRARVHNICLVVVSNFDRSSWGGIGRYFVILLRWYTIWARRLLFF